jgi:hypothetical protein
MTTARATFARLSGPRILPLTTLIIGGVDLSDTYSVPVVQSEMSDIPAVRAFYTVYLVADI